MVAIIERARGQGLGMTYDVYPYAASSAGLVNMLPEWAQQGGT